MSNDSARAAVAPAAVTFEGITFRYGPNDPTPAVAAIDLEIEPGSLVVLVGPSGCGKSTLLRIVAGLLYPSQGRLLIDGVDMSATPPEERQVGWVPQSYALFEHLNVADNIAFGLRRRGISKEERATRIAAMLELCQIPELAQRPVSDLSGGQRQRVAIARALAVQPRVLLLDEPLAALDPQLRLSLRAKLDELLRESGVTTLFVTHDQSEALAIADRIAVLRAGRLEQYDRPERLWTRPANEFVATFVGGAHLLPARRLDSNAVEIAPGLVARIDAAYGHGRHNGESVVVALRATDLICHQDGLAVVVTAAEYTGGHYTITAETAHGATLSFFSAERLAHGARVTLGLRPEAKVAVVGE
jgi:ABC-type Fe3+/spermidine/putrescine transport system ATPase subunit